MVPLVLALALAGCDSGNSSTGNAPRVLDRPVLTETIHFEDLTETRTFAATIKPRIESDLGFRVTGKVAKRLVQNGDRVSKGQPLLVLDTNDLELQLQQAEAEVRAAKTNLVQAEADEARATELQKKGWTAAATLEKSRATAEEARGRLTRAQRSLDLARNSLDYATLEADADGVITATPVEPGQVVPSGQAAVRLARLAEVEALVALPETFVERARQATGSLTLWSVPDRAYPVKLRELSPAADAATRTYAARYTIPAADEAVRLGMSATLTLREGTGTKAARLPLTALLNQGRGPIVWVVDKNGKLEPRPVSVAGYEGKTVLIAAGVKEGETVVTLGVQKLDPGLTVRPVASLAF
ncbi:efflux RND transporter periplasmic adaptor subunit [Rhodoplanes sp. TEM]|uniref:Efflux RND transporter periplasmic adaptor subunit n=1 Tax=Rhodoplanes tepidamans TaxID=200616 RepID=A0ABT5J392_RHOTP|nr:MULTISPECIES: efflux RND transporter periplasmic adaptor subunit [Rhodoplanes]MDC7784139.1 efflux RND transporter periplasmic adaptor subunit [Rhodoplanes tepidamans]MDC7983234.1 efflux RND transporter periplasmic adaptor subunit [Rhodoplanes sp. TEM]MDQ0356763.1 RND family efflux transporter MFP subunit [Rhodoplanes tepidamans]